MSLVLNATPLIYLTRAGLHWVFEAVGEAMFSTPSVYSEVVERGKELGRPDARVLEDFFKRKIIVVRAPEGAVLRKIQEITAKSVSAPLHAGEAEVLALTKELGAVAIIDEKTARGAGEVLGIEIRGNSYLVGLMIRHKKLELKQAIQAINKMVSSGWRISAEDYLKVVEEMEKW